MKKDYISTKLAGLELAVFRQWRKLPAAAWNPSGRNEVRVLLSVSGGADSMALAHLLIRLKSRMKLQIEVATIHHGNPHGNPRGDRRGVPRDLAVAGQAQVEFRDQAQALVVREIAKLDPEIRTHCLRVAGSDELSAADQSEAGLRMARWKLLQNLIQRDFDWVVFGHHEDDLLETRLIRLLRGTGLQGLCGMSELSLVQDLPIWRPLLTVTAADIRAYLAAKGCRSGTAWLDDPSNHERSILRNRIRHELLPMIEKVRQGGVKSLKRSLENIVAEHATESEAFGLGTGLSRDELMNLSLEQRRQKLSRWLKEQSVRNYSKAHIDEALKRLDTRRKRLKFELCGRVWIVDTRIHLATASQSFSDSSSS